MDEYAHPNARHHERNEITRWQLGIEVRLQRMELRMAALGALAGVAAFAAGVLGTLFVQRLFTGG